jgi:hypothetical protein
VATLASQQRAAHWSDGQLPRAVLLPALLQPLLLTECASGVSDASCGWRDERRWRRLRMLSCDPTDPSAVAANVLSMLELTALEADAAAAAAAMPASPDAAKAAWVALKTAREADEMLAARVLSLSNGLAGARDDLLLRMAVRVAASESASLRRAALLEGPLAAPVALLCAKQSKSGADAAKAIASWGRAATASLSGFSQALRCTVRAAVFRPERVR